MDFTREVWEPAVRPRGRTPAPARADRRVDRLSPARVAAGRMPRHHRDGGVRRSPGPLRDADACAAGDRARAREAGVRTAVERGELPAGSDPADAAFSSTRSPRRRARRSSSASAGPPPAPDAVCARR